VLGETIAWIVGWSLILEYSLVVSTVAVGWSGYASPLLIAVGFPKALTMGPELGGIANVPAIFIIAVVAGLLCVGTKESARLNTILVLIKIVTLALFVAVALPAFNAQNLHPFMPHGFAKVVEPDGTGHLTTIGVAPEYRRRGLARLMMHEIERSFADRGVRTIRLEVRVGNVGAHRLYDQLGYVAVKRMDRYYSNGDDGYLMVKALDLV